VIDHLFTVPASPYTEEEPAAAEAVYTGHFLGGRDRIPLYDQAYPCADPQAAGGRSGCGARHERVVRVQVHLRKVAAERVGR